MKTVKSALLLAGVILSGSLFATEAEDYGRRVMRPNEVILMSNSIATVREVARLVGHIDADVLNFRSGQVNSQRAAF